eukprot:TRINITY_DN15804_c0_g2_i2.p1 TRINITY_DN15804_c0_g2~~TRINITY_DN15804_c0_g2_i2.p1  ORF type:complete len:621 (-),score=72.20 TRINITY_DN15804_c0_g2_i2:579-2441(-)
MFNMASWQDTPPEAYYFSASFGLSVVFLITYAIMLIRTGVMTFSRDKLRRAAVALLEKLVQQLRSKMETDSFEDKVRQLAEVQRVERTKWAIAYLLHFLALLTGISTVVVAQHMYVQGVKFQDIAYARFMWQTSAPLVVILSFGMALYTRFFESAVGPMTLNVFHIVLFARMVWEVSLSIDVHQQMAILLPATLARFFLAGCIGTPLCTACLNAIYTTASCVTYFTLLADVPATDAERLTTTFGGPRRVVLVQIVIGLATWVCCILVAGWTAHVERSKLRLRAALTREATTKSLQAVVCDAVVNVTEALVLTEPSTQLGNFLVCPPPNGSYEGTSLLAFVQEEDRERVGQQVTSSLVGPGTTLSISTKLVDGNKALVSVQMYCVPFIDCEDRRGYCIGILEVKDTSGSTCRLDNCVVQAHDGVPHPAMLAADFMRSVSEVGADPAADCSAESVVSGVVPLVMDAGVLEASVDLSDAKLLILSTSPSMTMLAGPLQAGSSSLVDWFRQEEGAVVLELMAEALKRYARRREALLAVANLGQVRLQPRHTLRAGLQYVADLTLDMTKTFPDDSDGSASQIPVVLRFSNIGMQKASKRMRLNSLRSRQPESALVVVDRVGKVSL